jgi:hypothetical protein
MVPWGKVVTVFAVASLLVAVAVVYGQLGGSRDKNEGSELHRSLSELLEPVI